MSFLPGYGVDVFANERKVSTLVSGTTIGHSRAVSEVTCGGQAAATAGASFIPGLRGGSLSLRGPQDSDSTAGLHREIAESIGVDNDLLLTVAWAGTAIGMPVGFAACDVTDWTVDSSVADAVALNVAAMPDEGVEMGFVLHPWTAETATGNGTAVDRGTVSTPSTRGLVAALHVTAFTGFTSVALKIQHSADNSSWADLAGGGFTSVTAVGKQLITVASGVTINRYLRAVTTVTGTGSITYLMAVGPR